jgi:hypothetical protein
MKVYEIITENPIKAITNKALKWVGKLRGKGTQKSDPISPEAAELEAAEQWYNSQKTKPQFDTGIKDQSGRPIKRDMTNDEILDAFKQTDAYKKFTQEQLLKKLAENITNLITQVLGKTAPAGVEKAGMTLFTKIFGGTLSSGIMAALTQTQLAWSLIVYLETQERIKSGNYLNYKIENQEDKDILLKDARGKLYQAWLSQIAVAGVHLLHIWILIFTRGKINKLEALISFGKTTVGYQALQLLMATQAWNNYAVGLFHYLINSTSSEGNRMTNTSVQEFWDNSGFVDAMIDQAEVWYNKLLGWGVDLKAIPN